MTHPFYNTLVSKNHIDADFGLDKTIYLPDGSSVSGELVYYEDGKFVPINVTILAADEMSDREVEYDELVTLYETVPAVKQGIDKAAEWYMEKLEDEKPRSGMSDERFDYLAAIGAIRSF